MGFVFKAWDELLERDVAIKFLEPGLIQNPTAVTRFQREALAAGRIGHDNICDVRDRGVTDAGLPYIVMERLEGVSLEDLYDREAPIEKVRLTRLVLQVLSALEAAHEKGIVHRDLKPANIFIVQNSAGEEQIKLLDFGISKFLSESIGAQVTRTGTVIGTALYMSAEQAMGEAGIDHRSDLWAVGVIFYEGLVGVPPFRGKGYNRVISNILLNDPPEPSVMEPDVPMELDAAIMKALHKDRDERYADAAEFADVLGTWLKTQEEDYPPIRRAATSTIESNLDNGTSRESDVHFAETRETPQSPSLPLPFGDASSAAKGGATVTTTGEEREGRLHPNRTAILLGLAALFALVLGGWIVFFELRTNQPASRIEREAVAPSSIAPPMTDASAPRLRAEAAPQPKVATSESIELRIRVEPESARLRVDNVEVEGHPFVGRFRRDGEAHRVDASAPGYQNSSRTLIFDQDSEVEITLERAGRPQNRRESEEESVPQKRDEGRFERENPYGGT